ncbi:MAG: Lrp/AsnC family transcriptional regulator [Alphaproteobacteria bacterium]|jgi:Lrp/AsnC family transcriptional regulator|nr:Lrp/AsnC family transcriptional regulator [Rhodospirillaceae bacterium]MBT6508950.1 Lrp/AsnC family transcriptional regulator [Rhodospirillaceae bacterium]MBT7614237.1 Lrp/AsnC family transcriptional regulator [Rhodospirillaceae bacterium]MBT7646468.1 Lrp/AsnC family transcriptional regulator [Rhodospirillaceae bacterium]MDG2481686.1 Lrp/AsnC family transcriptional regulator [Alphaproteobacteria bacterium]
MLNETDKALLALVQQDATLSLAEMSEKVHLSTTPCWRRLQRLERDGYIARRVALLDPDRMNVPITVFVAVRTDQHNEDWLATFAEGVASVPEVVEIYRMAGEIDYLLKVVVPDIQAYDRVYKALIAKARFFDVSSMFAMERIKHTSELPLAYV